MENIEEMTVFYCVVGPYDSCWQKNRNLKSGKNYTKDTATWQVLT